jgi:hypothetical protein
MDTDSDDSVDEEAKDEDVNEDAKDDESSSLGSSTEIVESDPQENSERTDSGEITDELSTSYAFWWPFVYKSASEKETLKHE